MNITKVGIIGLGLIGGSLAKAIHLAYKDCQIIAYDTNYSRLQIACQDGVIQQGVTTIDDHFSGCDFIFLCAPVSINQELIVKLSPYLTENTILTDVGSVKGTIHQYVKNSSLPCHFIGGHPMTGSEKTGYENSDPYLFENAYYIITAEEEVPQSCINLYKELLLAVKAVPIILSSKEHDKATAMISHLPHVIAACLVQSVRKGDFQNGLMWRLAAGGFKDITRIASSNPNVWEPICLANKNSLQKGIQSFLQEMELFSSYLSLEDGAHLQNYFQQAKDYRDSLNDTQKGLISKEYVLYLDLVDETGGIANIATILASHHINMKNIGIVHNREFEEGVLRIEFYNASDTIKASDTLKEHNYTIYMR